MASLSAALLSSSSHPSSSSPLFYIGSALRFNLPAAVSPPATNNFLDAYSLKYVSKKRVDKMVRKAGTIAAPAAEEIEEYKRPPWSAFELGQAPVYWRTFNGGLPTSGQKLILFYNPKNKLVPHDEFGIAFNGGFNQPIMCGGEPRQMTKKNRGTTEPPLFAIKIYVPKHAVNLIFSFTNGMDWDGPYKLRFEVPERWKDRPLSFFNEGLAQELSKDGACDKAIFPEANIVETRCAMIGNLSAVGGDRCKLDLVPGCTDPSSPDFNPLANVDDGSCPVLSDSEE